MRIFISQAEIDKYLQNDRSVRLEWEQLGMTPCLRTVKQKLLLISLLLLSIFDDLLKIGSL
jgi:hypothetical protein